MPERLRREAPDEIDPRTDRGAGSAALYPGAGATAGRGAACCTPRQPRVDVDARRGDDLDSRADDGGIQQPRRLRSARAAEPPVDARAGPRRELVVERGPPGIELSP